ncbi:Transmembrane protein [Orchesella cincta]|uniref:Transmembrane protein n=1 Tax=Orchesella cincta TaxID=48709 RepID=A0A1D2MHB2_ORCCI|nr:Transmembrane protein [Orchesella cincta]
MRRRRRTWKEKWRLWHLGAVERYYFEQKENTTHPFEDLGDGFYYITVRSDKFLFGVGLITTTVTCFTLFCLFVGFYGFPLALFLVTFSYGVFSMYGNLSTKELIISRNGGYLMRFKGTTKPLVEEPIHNCYIKLQRKYDANKLPHYYLILGGFRLDDIRITGSGAHDGALRLLGSRLAARMGINYFDYDNNSTLHQIIHYPGFTTLKHTDEEYTKFLQEHKISDDDVARALIEENLPQDTSIAPERIVRRIKENYKAGQLQEVDEGDKRSRRNVISKRDITSLKRTVQLLQNLRRFAGPTKSTNPVPE